MQYAVCMKPNACNCCAFLITVNSEWGFIFSFCRFMASKRSPVCLLCSVLVYHWEMKRNLLEQIFMLIRIPFVACAICIVVVILPFHGISFSRVQVLWIFLFFGNFTFHYSLFSSLRFSLC